MTTAEPHPALAHPCLFCHADPGQPCRTHRGRGRELDWPHSRRLAIVDDWMRRERTAEQALCCECGALRTFKKARNYVAERCDNQTWHRMTGDLKCDTCDRITRHALLRSGEHRDAGEEYQRVALGGKPADRYEDVDRARREFRQGLPRNPYLTHRRYTADAQKAWDDGTKMVIALCGEPIEVKVDPRQAAQYNKPDQRVDGYLIAKQLSDTEYEDPETGLWWLDMDCVDCARLSNEAHYARRRKLLESWLAWFACHPETIPDAAADALSGIFGPLADAIQQRQD